MGKILIVYFSRKGENYYGGRLKNLTKGNTNVFAEYIQKAVGGDLFEVETVREYAADYHTCVQEAKQELLADTRPELKTYLDSIEPYDTIFVGFPNWCRTMPMGMFTFLERYDFSGKRIIPFITHEGGGIGNSEKDLKHVCRSADIAPICAVPGYQVTQREGQIAQWAKSQL